METAARLFIVLSLLCANSAPTEQLTRSPAKILPERISFYEVPLVCPAAPHIAAAHPSRFF